MTHLILTRKIQKPTDGGDDAYSVFATHEDPSQEYDNVSFSMGEACNKDIGNTFNMLNINCTVR